MAASRIMAGVNKDFLEKIILLFIGGDIGADWPDSKTSSVSDSWLFTLDLKGYEGIPGCNHDDLSG